MNEQPWEAAVRESATIAHLEEELRTTKMMVAILIRKFGKSTEDGGHRVALSDTELAYTSGHARLTVYRDMDYLTTTIEVDR